MSQWPRYIQRESELVILMSFEGSREAHIGRIIVLIGLPVKAWWSAPLKSLVEHELDTGEQCDRISPVSGERGG